MQNGRVGFIHCAYNGTINGILLYRGTITISRMYEPRAKIIVIHDARFGEISNNANEQFLLFVWMTSVVYLGAYNYNGYYIMFLFSHLTRSRLILILIKRLMRKVLLYTSRKNLRWRGKYFVYFCRPSGYNARESNSLGANIVRPPAGDVVVVHICIKKNIIYHTIEL